MHMSCRQRPEQDDIYANVTRVRLKLNRVLPDVRAEQAPVLASTPSGRGRGGPRSAGAGHSGRSDFVLPDSSLGSSKLQNEGTSLARALRSKMPQPSQEELQLRRLEGSLIRP